MSGTQHRIYLGKQHSSMLLYLALKHDVKLANMAQRLTEDALDDLVLYTPSEFKEYEAWRTQANGGTPTATQLSETAGTRSQA